MKYLNEGIIGNKNMLATFTEKGELLRLYFPNRLYAYKRECTC